MTQINQPIFIIGAGRSGTSVFYNHFATHPDLCWFSNYSDRFYRFPFMPFLHRVIDLPVIGSRLKTELMKDRWATLRPSEGSFIYHDYCEFEYNRKTDETNLTPKQEARLISMIRRHLSQTGKKRFVNKQTANNQRLSILHKLFPDAFYIHLIRDGRAVANSLRNVNWWKDMDFWWNYGLNREDLSGLDNTELAGLHWMKNVEEILDNRDLFSDRYIEIRYEDLVQNFRHEMQKTIQFCGLQPAKDLLIQLPTQLPGQNEKWKSSLTDQQKKNLHQRIAPMLEKLGYS